MGTPLSTSVVTPLHPDLSVIDDLINKYKNDHCTLPLWVSLQYAIRERYPKDLIVAIVAKFLESLGRFILHGCRYYKWHPDILGNLHVFDQKAPDNIVYILELYKKACSLEYLLPDIPNITVHEHSDNILVTVTVTAELPLKENNILYKREVFTVASISASRINLSEHIAQRTVEEFKCELRTRLLAIAVGKFTGLPEADRYTHTKWPSRVLEQPFPSEIV